MGCRSPHDIGAPLAGRKNLPNGSIDNPAIIPCHVPLRNAFSPPPFPLLVSRIGGAQLSRLDSRSDIEAREVFLATGAPSDDLFTARESELFPSATNRIGPSANLDVGHRFAPPAGLLPFLSWVPRPRSAKSAELQTGLHSSSPTGLKQGIQIPWDRRTAKGVNFVGRGRGWNGPVARNPSTRFESIFFFL